jgi:outer membrane lipoprotein-sorting protein
MAGNKNYYLLVIDNPDFGHNKVTVKKGETITSIANRLFLNDRMILELNPGCSDYDDVKAGDVLTVPNGFAKKIVFHIDKKNMLPLIQTTYDDKGLYGKVTFSSFVLNPEFSDNDFSRSNPKYNF